MPDSLTQPAPTTDPTRLDGRVALLTGASGASAGPVAHALAARGAELVLVHRGTDPARVDALADELAAGGAAAHVVVADVSDAQGAARAVEATVAAAGHLDVLVHLAGLAPHGAIADLDDATWHAGIAANLDSAFFLLRAAAGAMGEGGRIVLTSSSLTAVTGPDYGAYSPAKAALEHLVRIAAKELGSRGITVNAVAPGPIDSPMVVDALPPEVLERVRAQSPMHRLGTWEEVAPAYAFLASPAAGWISAQTLRVNGAMV